MIPISQGSTSNCFGAALASLLEIPLGLVPDFNRYRSGDTQNEAMQEWLDKNYGATYLEISAAAAKQAALPTLGIVTLRFKKPTRWHAVVGRAHRTHIEVVWDPDAATECDRPGVATAVGYLLPQTDRIRICCATRSPSSPA